MFRLILKNKLDETYSLDYQVYSTDIAIRWYQSLVEQVSRDNSISEPDRLYGFPNSWTEEKLVQKLNDCISIINSSSPLINHNAYVGMGQEDLNILHLYFEKLRGGIKTPSDYWLSATHQQQKNLTDYNVYIHRAEEFYRNKEKPTQPRIVCTFNGTPENRKELLDDDYNHFTFDKKFGEVYINYCEVGKPLYDVCKDDDLLVTDENIRPLRYYSADFNVYFYDRDPILVNSFLNRIDQWWDQNTEHLSKLGFTKGDPKNAMGNIPVAKLMKKYSKNSIINIFSEYDTMHKVEIL